MIQTPLKINTHVELPPYTLPSPDFGNGDYYSITQDGDDGSHFVNWFTPVGCAAADFTMGSWQGRPLLSSLAAQMPVLWSEDAYNYHIMTALDGETFSTPSHGPFTIHPSTWYTNQPAPRKFGKANTLVRLPKMIFCDTGTYDNTVAAAAGIAGFANANIMIAKAPMANFLTVGLPVHDWSNESANYRTILTAFTPLQYTITYKVQLPVVNPDRFIGGMLLGLFTTQPFGWYYAKKTTFPNSVSLVDFGFLNGEQHTVSQCLPRFVKWANIWWNSIIVHDPVAGPFIAGAVAPFAANGWQFIGTDSPSVDEITTQIRSFFGL